MRGSRDRFTAASAESGTLPVRAVPGCRSRPLQAAGSGCAWMPVPAAPGCRFGLCLDAGPGRSRLPVRAVPGCRSRPLQAVQSQYSTVWRRGKKVAATFGKLGAWLGVSRHAGWNRPRRRWYPRQPRRWRAPLAHCGDESRTLEDDSPRIRRLDRPRRAVRTSSGHCAAGIVICRAGGTGRGSRSVPCRDAGTDRGKRKARGGGVRSGSRQRLSADQSRGDLGG